MKDMEVYTLQWEENLLSPSDVESVMGIIRNAMYDKSRNTMYFVDKIREYLVRKKDNSHIPWMGSDNYYLTRNEILWKLNYYFPLNVWKDSKGTKIQKTIKKLYHIFDMDELYDEKEWSQFWSQKVSFGKKLYYRLFDPRKEPFWTDGDFGDSGSCFWGDRSAALETLTEHEQFRGVLFYDAQNFSKEPTFEELVHRRTGWGRCWLWYRKKGGFLLFNFYSKEKNRFQGNIMAERIAQSLGLCFKSVNIDNYGKHDETLYLNDGLGYLLTEQPATLSKFDFQIDVDYMSCEYCGRSINEDNCYCSPSGESICEDCYYENFFCCCSCGDDYSHDERHVFNVWEYCDECIDKVAVYSDFHGAYISKENAFYLDYTDEWVLLEDGAVYSNYRQEWIADFWSEFIQVYITYNEEDVIEEVMLEDDIDGYLSSIDLSNVKEVRIVHKNTTQDDLELTAAEIAEKYQSVESQTAEETIRSIAV